VHAKGLVKKCCGIIEPKLDDTQCGFRRDRSTTDQIYILQQFFEKSWEHTEDVHTSFDDLGKVYDRVPPEKSWVTLR